MTTLAVLAAAALLGGGGGGGATSPARLGLSVSPSHLRLATGARATIRVAVKGGPMPVLRASVSGIALDRRGRPRLAVASAGAAGAPITVTTRPVTLEPLGATFVVTARRRAGIAPGDHSAIVLVTATTATGRAIVVTMRIGLVVTVEVPGRRLHRLQVLAARVRRGRPGRMVDLTVANRGNVIETVGGPGLRVTLLRRGRVIARLHPTARAVLPRTRAVLTLWCPLRHPGPVIVRVVLTGAGGASAARSFHLRL